MTSGVNLDDRNAWDDSMLVDGWNEVLEEYQKYHSIQAQGKRLEDVLSKEELKELREDYGDLLEEEYEEETRCSNADPNANADQERPDGSAHQTNGDGGIRQDAVQAEEPPAAGHREQQTRAVDSPTSAHNTAHPAAAMPQAILGTVHDENLKNLMMSWYYAGYYTGVYAGQQQGSPPATQAK
ncbi:hypothetical protein BCR34DRAFT_625060 [Clohesyomyces aquaticus]|uniref:Survival motor neuron Tudor domain-containing protein n=1 Tax=Clohesyomyces aquaticus TaxID=1231657 RepID=A0A1Y1ZKT7_9PLEO|nr:hypothetical protein BCR34DRAFT_625060 [Clohesyomyces aquaticus]